MTLECLQTKEHAYSQSGEPMCIWGSYISFKNPSIQAPFRQVPITAEMGAFNKSMSNVRVAVEWVFGDITNYFIFMDFKKNLKIGLSQVGKMD